MRTTPLLLLSVLALPLTAQQFEGRITMKIPEGNQEINWTVKGAKSLIVLPAVGGAGDTRVIMDTQARTATILAFLPGQGGIRLTMPTDAAATTTSTTTATPAAGAPRKLGTTQTIAGHKCDDYEMPDAEKTRLCITTALGAFMVPSTGGGAGMGMLTGGRSGAASALSTAQSWSKVLPANSFPLKVWTGENKVMLEVVRAVKETVPADAFAIPADYTDMTAMLQQFQSGRGRGGGH